jgi:hypothetical protein
MKLTNNERVFLGDLISNCYENGINVIIKNQKTINKCSGYFDGLTLGIALKCFKGSHSSVMGTIVHESCHVDQYLENISIWNDPVFNSGDMWALYLKNKIGKTKKLKRYFKTLLDIELDCERRAVQKIIKYNLPIDISNYIKLGNIYLYAYRRFYDDKLPLGWYTKMSLRKEVLDLMPDKYCDNSSEYWDIKTNLLCRHFKGY